MLVSRYCGRNATDIGSYGTKALCGPCPWGYKTNNYVCLECTDSLSHYEILFLVFMITLLVYPQVYSAFCLRHLPNSIGILLLFSPIIETCLALIAALLIMKPIGSLTLFSCGIDRLSDWYPTLFPGPLDCPNSAICTSEAAYPLLSWVLFVDGIALLFIIFFRMPLNIFYFHGQGKWNFFFL